MSIIEAIILGIIQGATEFLPISSSGHLLLVPALFGMASPDLNVIAIAHVGTLLAVFIYFRLDLWQIMIGTLDGLRQRSPMATSESRLGWYIVIGSIPAAVAGLTMNDFFEEIFGSPTFAAFFLLGTALLLVIGERMLTGQRSLERLRWSDAIIIGLAQMLALLPGISRSGSTITAGLARGLDRPTAARYSFLLGVPAIFGAGLLASLELLDILDIAQQLPVLLATFIAAAIVGYACIHFLLSWLRQRSLYGFALYCAAFGIFFLILAALG